MSITITIDGDATSEQIQAVFTALDLHAAIAGTSIEGGYVPSDDRTEVVAHRVRRPAQLHDLRPGDRIDVDYVTGDGELRDYRDVPVLRIDHYLPGYSGISHILIEDPIDGDPRLLSTRGGRLTDLFRYTLEDVS